LGTPSCSTVTAPGCGGSEVNTATSSRSSSDGHRGGHWQTEDGQCPLVLGAKVQMKPHCRIQGTWSRVPTGDICHLAAPLLPSVLPSVLHGQLAGVWPWSHSPGDTWTSLSSGGPARGHWGTRDRRELGLCGHPSRWVAKSLKETTGICLEPQGCRSLAKEKRKRKRSWASLGTWGTDKGPKDRLILRSCSCHFLPGRPGDPRLASRHPK
jgi:hypothetical protein